MRVIVYQATGTVGKKTSANYSFRPLAHTIPGETLAEIEIEAPEGWRVDEERDRLVRDMPSGNLEARRVHTLATSQMDGFRLVESP
jgi:hypothetical protein